MVIRQGPRVRLGVIMVLVFASLMPSTGSVAQTTTAPTLEATPAVATPSPAPASEAPAPEATASEATLPDPSAPGVPELPAADPIPGPAQTAPTISASGAVLFDPADGIVLTGVDERTARPMASTTKIMTVLLALERVEQGVVAPDLTVSAFAAEVGRIPGAATLDLPEGETLPVRDVLAGLLLRSGNDGAVAVAEHVSGSEPAFVAAMNQRSTELGLENTSFVNASGLTDDPAHHATPLDLALLGQEAMGHPDFARWAGAVELDVPALGALVNRNEMLTAYDGATGIKTGFTNLAGLCLVASAERDGRTLYAVVLGSDDRVADTSALFDHGFRDYQRPVPLVAGDAPATYRWAGSEVALEVAEELGRTIGAGAVVETVTRLAPDAGLPVAAGTPLGEVVLVVDGEEVDRTPLLAATAVSGPSDDAGAAVADAMRAFARLGDRRLPVTG